jgi:phospholipid/cholesterol/gamma-HCH transport system substrate-binding protein
METRVNYFLVGIFVLVLGAAMVAGLLWLSVGTSTRDYDYYYVYMTESVSGLNTDAPVKFLGVDVGRVTEIRIDQEKPDRVRLLLAIEKGTPIREDTVAVLAFQGLTGIAHLNLTGQISGESPPLKAAPGEKYPVIKSSPSLLLRLDEGATRLITSVTEAADSLRTFLGGPNEESVSNSLANLEKLLKTLAARTDSIDAALKAAAHTMQQSSEASDRLPELFDKLQQAEEGLIQMAEDIARQSNEISRAATTGAEGLTQISNQAGYEIRVLSVQLQDLMYRLDTLVQKVEQDPSILLHGSPKPPPGPGE